VKLLNEEVLFISRKFKCQKSTHCIFVTKVQRWTFIMSTVRSLFFFVVSGNNTAYLNKWCVSSENLDCSLR
jgi:hypothetical protein